MDGTAIYIGSLKLGWGFIIVIPAVLAWLSLCMSLYGGRRVHVFPVMFPMVSVFSIFISRAIYWYSHYELYNGFSDALSGIFKGALADGGYEVYGILSGLIIAAFLAGRMKGSGGSLAILDVSAPATAFLTGFLFLSDAFSDKCRSKFVFDISTYSPSMFFTVDADSVTVRLAVYLVYFMLFTAAGFFMLIIYTRFKDRKMCDGGRNNGMVFLLFLNVYGAISVICDSARYDSSYFRSNGFVSMIQIFSALVFIACMVLFSKRVIKGRGFKPYMIFIWLFFTAAVAGTVYAEYYIQRHMGAFKEGYAGMAAGLLTAFSCIFITFLLMYGKNGAKAVTETARLKETGAEVKKILNAEPDINLGKPEELLPEGIFVYDGELKKVSFKINENIKRSYIVLDPEKIKEVRTP